MYPKNSEVLVRNKRIFNEASKEMYKDLYYRAPGPYKGNNNRFTCQLIHGFIGQGFMTNSPKAKLTISIRKHY